MPCAADRSRWRSPLVVAVVALFAVAPGSALAAAVPAVAPGSALAALAAPSPTPAYAAPGLVEASGLAASVLHPGIVWVVEDSGEPIVRAFDATGAQLGSVLFTASDVFAGDNRDTEALSMGPGPTLWSADIGDNDAIRETVLVHTTPEPADLTDIEVTATSYRFTYLDGPRDGEAFLVDPVDGRAYIATKSLSGGGWYAAPSTLVPGETHGLTKVQDLTGWLTDGAFSPDGATVALRTGGFTGNGVAQLYDVVRDPGGGPVQLSKRAEVDLPHQEQGESLAFTTDGTALLVGSEGETEPIWSVEIPAGLLELRAPPPSRTASVSASPASSATTAATGAGAPSSDVGRDSESVDDTCGFDAATACLTEPTALLALLVAVLVALLTGIMAVRRRA